MNHVDELLDLLEIESGHLKKGTRRDDSKNPDGPVRVQPDRDGGLDSKRPGVLGRVT